LFCNEILKKRLTCSTLPPTNGAKRSDQKKAIKHVLCLVVFLFWGEGFAGFGAGFAGFAGFFLALRPKSHEIIERWRWCRPN
jgi:hypothetical protein